MASDAMETSTDLIFDSLERAMLEIDPDLQTYRDLTKPHVLGLLSAVADCASRIGPAAPPGVSSPVAREACAAVLGFFLEAHLTSDSPRPARFRRSELIRVSPPEDAIFDAAEREHLSLDKYLKDHRGITRRQLLHLLAAATRYGRVAPLLPPGPARFEALQRIVHGHNAFVYFTDRPFSGLEFRRSLEAILVSGEQGPLARSPG